jgi:hypothetical protein
VAGASRRGAPPRGDHLGPAAGVGAALTIGAPFSHHHLGPRPLGRLKPHRPGARYLGAVALAVLAPLLGVLVANQAAYSGAPLWVQVVLLAVIAGTAGGLIARLARR